MGRNLSQPNRISSLRTGIAKRRELLESGSLSSNVDSGSSVIFTTGDTEEDLLTLEEHSESLALDTSRAFYGAEIVRQAKANDIRSALENPDIVSIAFIGDGNFGTYNISAGHGRYERITWGKLSKWATHLKQGIMEERTCTELTNPAQEVRVSLSSLIAVDQRDIQGTVGMSFGNHVGFETFNLHVGQIYGNSSNNAMELRQPIGFEL